MKLVGKLNEKVSKAKSNEEAKELIKEAGMELTDEELEQVSGGEYVGLNSLFWEKPGKSTSVL